jgi:hypothetical protein
VADLCPVAFSVPPPGEFTALRLGCLCPGTYWHVLRWRGVVYYVNPLCPLHVGWGTPLSADELAAITSVRASAAG